jgi:hypothetical protein
MQNRGIAMNAVSAKHKKKIAKNTSRSIFDIMKRKLEDKEAIDRYYRGEITLEELYARGIKFVQPL